MGGPSVCQFSSVLKSVRNFYPVFWKRWLNILLILLQLVCLFVFVFPKWSINRCRSSSVLLKSGEIVLRSLSERSDSEHLWTLRKEKHLFSETVQNSSGYNLDFYQIAWRVFTFAYLLRAFSALSLGRTPDIQDVQPHYQKFSSWPLTASSSQMIFQVC